MKGILIGLALTVGLCISTCLIAVLVVISYQNSEVRLRNAAQAQQQANEAVFDNLWKTVSQQAQVSNEYKDSFGKIWKEIIAGRYDNNHGSMASFIKEHNPEFSPALYKKLMNTIEASRKDFLNNQKRLIDIHREHQNLVNTFPGSLVCSNKTLDIVIMTSDKTQDAFHHGENNVEVFGK
jgi:hypothetical protein